MDAQEAKYIQMTQSPVEKLVIGFAGPAIVCMLVSALYNLADSYFVGQLDTQSVAALGVVYPFMSLIQAGSFFFGHGSGNYISRALGARNTSGASAMATTGLLTAMGLVAAISAVSAVFMRPLLHLMGSTATIMPYAVDYFKYILLGSPFISACFVLNNQMRLQGNARDAMYGIMSGVILNVLLDPLFIYVFKMGVAGAGLATAISQFVGAMLLIRLSFRDGGVGIHPKEYHLDWSVFKEILAGGLPSLFRQGLLAIAGICLNGCARQFGDSAVAAFSVVSRVMMVASAAMIGFGQGFQPVCGFNYGAKLYDRVRHAFKFAAVVMTGYAVVVGAIGLGFAPGIVKIFRAEDAEVISIGTRALRWQCLTFPLAGFVVMTNMYLQNTRQTLPAVLVALARQGLFLVPAIFIGTAFWGLSGLTLAQSVSDVCALALSVPLCHKYMSRMK